MVALCSDVHRGGSFPPTEQLTCLTFKADYYERFNTHH